MKILIFSNMYPTIDKPQFGIYVYNQVKLLEKKGAEFKIVSLKSRGNKYIRYLSFFIRGIYYSIFAGREYQIVHAHYAFPPGLFAKLHKKRYRSKMVVTVHGSDVNKMPTINSILNEQIGQVVSSADSVICVSESLKEKLSDLYDIKESKVHIVNMGVNTDVFKPRDKKAMRKGLKLPEGDFIILFAGNFYAAKGIKDLIRAFKRVQIPGKHLILIGDANVELNTAEFVNNISERNITVIGPKPQLVLAKYMAAADVFTLPSYSEGFNLVTIEAMSAGTLLLTSDIEAFDYLPDDIVIKSKVGDVAGLRKSLEKAMEISIKIERNKYLKNVEEIVKENDYKQKAIEVYKIYNKLLS